MSAEEPSTHDTPNNDTIQEQEQPAVANEEKSSTEQHQDDAEEQAATNVQQKTEQIAGPTAEDESSDAKETDEKVDATAPAAQEDPSSDSPRQEPVEQNTTTTSGEPTEQPKESTTDEDTKEPIETEKAPESQPDSDDQPEKEKDAPPPPPATTEEGNPSSPTKSKKSLEPIKRRIMNMFLKYQPDKLFKAEEGMVRYEGKEEALLRALVKKFGAEPSEEEVSKLINAGDETEADENQTQQFTTPKKKKPAKKKDVHATTAQQPGDETSNNDHDTSTVADESPQRQKKKAERVDAELAAQLLRANHFFLHRDKLEERQALLRDDNDMEQRMAFQRIIVSERNERRSCAMMESKRCLTENLSRGRVQMKKELAELDEKRQAAKAQQEHEQRVKHLVEKETKRRIDNFEEEKKALRSIEVKMTQNLSKVWKEAVRRDREERERRQREIDAAVSKEVEETKLDEDDVAAKAEDKKKRKEKKSKPKDADEATSKPDDVVGVPEKKKKKKAKPFVIAEETPEEARTRRLKEFKTVQKKQREIITKRVEEREAKRQQEKEAAAEAERTVHGFLADIKTQTNDRNKKQQRDLYAAVADRNAELSQERGGISYSYLASAPRKKRGALPPPQRSQSSLEKLPPINAKSNQPPRSKTSMA